MNGKIPLFIVLFISFQILGCATVQTSRYLSRYTDMQAGEFIEKFYTNPQFHIKDYQTLIIKVDPYPIFYDTKTVNLNEMNTYLKTFVIVELRNSGLFPKVVDVTDFKEDDRSKKLICQVAITQLDPGNRAMRWMFGVGYTHVQIEGKLVDYDTKEEMFAFADHRVGTALLDITGGEPTTYIREDVSNIVFGLTKTLKALSE